MYLCGAATSYIILPSQKISFGCGPATGCARRLTPTYMWREQAKTYTHIYVRYVSFRKLIIAFPNGGQWTPFSKVCPP